MIHCYKLGGLNIVLDIYSGSVHVVDEVAYDIIEAYESADKEVLKSEIIAKHGITAALVLTGETKMADVDAATDEEKPDVLLDSLASADKLIFG